MARSAVGYSSRRRVRSEPKIVIAPIGGLNARDGLAAMPEQDAYLLDNLFPGTDSVSVRDGYEEHEGSVGDPVETLMGFTGITDVMLAVAGDTLYDVTTAHSASIVTAGYTSAQMYSTMFSNAGGQRLVVANGADAPFMFDGAATTALVITGVTGGQENLIYPFTFKHRLYFAAKDLLGFYVLDVDNIQGAASYFDLTQVAAGGGYLVAIASITRDAGDGPDDNIVFITSKGELIVYEGYDPTDINAWALVGRYKTGNPIGRRCAFKYGGDVLLLTDLGLIPITTIADGGPFDPTNDTVSAKLGSSLTDLMVNRNVFGWQIELHSPKNQLILNVPAGADESTYYQYVMNTVTLAWCRFTGMNGICWLEFVGNIYFGTMAGSIFKAATGTEDNGTVIRGQAKQAYNYFGDPHRKLFHTAKMILATTGPPSVYGLLNTDYVEDVPVLPAAPTPDAVVELVQNGTFATTDFWSLNEGDAPMVISGGTLNSTTSPLNAYAKQNFTEATLTHRTYSTSFRIVSITDGGVALVTGNGDSTVVRTAPGTYAEELAIVNPSTSELRVNCTPAVLGEAVIDNVSVKLVPAIETQEFWVDCNIDGFAASLNVNVAVQGAVLKWYATEYVYEMGGLI